MDSLPKSKTLLLFTTASLNDMLHKGNVWYVRNYEAYFGHVYVVYLCGSHRDQLTAGRTTLLSLGSGNTAIDILMAPVRLYRIANQLKPFVYLTADLVFSWWTSWMIRLFHGAQTYLMPVCIPDLIHKNTGRSLSGLPILCERIMIGLSFLAAYRVWTGTSFGSFVPWLQSHRLARRKLKLSCSLVEALPSQGFYSSLEKAIASGHSRNRSTSVFRVLYVGRLHREKLVSDAISALAAVIRDKPDDISVQLTLIGDGPDRTELQQLAGTLGVLSFVKFIGPVPNTDLPKHLLEADAFVSPLTGTALREAALCGLPIVAYDMDWISGLLQHEQDALLAKPGDVDGMARQLTRLMTGRELRERLSKNITALAWRLWSPDSIARDLQAVFEE